MITVGTETYPAVPPSSDLDSGATEIFYMYEVVKDEVSGNGTPIATFPDAGLELNSNGEFCCFRRYRRIRFMWCI